MLKLMCSFVIAISVVSVLGCATTEPSQVDSSTYDWRAGTDFSPYRSIAPVLQCGSCTSK